MKTRSQRQKMIDHIAQMYEKLTRPQKAALIFIFEQIKERPDTFATDDGDERMLEAFRLLEQFWTERLAPATLPELAGQALEGLTLN